MDNKGQKPQRGIPQLSRIPLPRANLSNVEPEEPKKLSHIPRPSEAGSSRLKERKLLVENVVQPPRSQYGWSARQTRNGIPIKPLSQTHQVVSLDTTPPKESDVYSIGGDENSNIDSYEGAQKQKRRPRPSLSERTLETLSQIPPSPSPSRRRPSIAYGGNDVTTPSRLGSSLRLSRSNANIGGRSMSPPKPLPRPASRIGLPARASEQQRDMSNRQQTPRAARVGGAPASTLAGRRFNESSLPRTTNRTNKESYVPVLNDIYHAERSSRLPDHKASLPGTSIKASATKTVLNHKPSTPRLAQATKTRQQVISSKPVPALNPIRDNVKGSTLISTSRQDEGVPIDDENDTRMPPKSSLILRETIARAKAASKQAVNPSIRSPPAPNNTIVATLDNDYTMNNHAIQYGEKSLQRRVRGAVTSGVLNIAAMSLRDLPQEIEKMYDFDPDSKNSWSEAVDLTKLLAADNELTELADNLFPDWTTDELESDEDKSNQFGGLQVLDIHNNYLIKVPIGLRRLQQLHILNLSSNRLELDALEVICQITSLRELILSKNQLKGSLPSTLANLTELQILDLRSNQLSVLPNDIEALQNLRKLDVSDNKFSYVSMTSLQRLPLVELNVSKNMLSDTFVEGSLVGARLQTLNVASNRLRCLCNGQLDLPRLQSLICDSNQLTSLPDLSLLESLTALTASENKIETLPKGFTSAKLLHSVDLSANGIKHLDPLVARMDNLATLNLAANPLRDRKYLAMSTDRLKAELAKRTGFDQVGAEHGSSDFGEQSDNTVTADMKYIFKPENGILNLSSQNLSLVDISAIDLSQPVHTVRLSNNKLRHFPLDLLDHPSVRGSLKTLDMSHNALLDPTRYLERSITLSSLRSLYIVSTGLSSLNALIEYLVASQLQELNISCHRLSGSVPCMRSHFPSLMTLLATDNWFTSVDVESIEGLEVVDIRNNHLEYLPPKIGELGNFEGSGSTSGRLRAFECAGNTFRVPRLAIIEKGTEAVLKDLRRMVPVEQIGSEWR